MFSNTLRIQSSPTIIWKALTHPELMQQWMGEPEMLLEIDTNWEVGKSIIIRGFHHVRFENIGVVLQYEPPRLLSYSSLNSVSHLPDIPENHCVLTFLLTPIENETELTITVHNFPTETIFKHLEFYWRTTLHLLKNFVEQKYPPSI
jgi:uncharacterized protein YndB with AHSA1/START domain